MITTKSIAQTALLCIGLFAANMVWANCPEGAKTMDAANPDKAQAETRALSASELYTLFHEAELNETDDLGDYVQNFQAD